MVDSRMHDDIKQQGAHRHVADGQSGLAAKGNGQADGATGWDAQESVSATKAVSGVADRFVLKSGDTFMVNDVFGDIGLGQDGLFVNDMRVLSRLSLRLDGHMPSLLSGNVNSSNTVFTAHLTNQPLPGLGEHSVAQGAIHIKRMRVLTGNGVDEAIVLTHYGDAPITIPLSIAFGADFKDMFEVRGTPRARRGVTQPPVVEGARVALRYRGLDEVERRVDIRFSPAPHKLTAEHADYLLDLEPHGCTTLYLSVSLDEHSHVNVHRTGDSGRAAGREGMRYALLAARRAMRTRSRESARIHSSNTQFNAWLARSKADLDLLTTDLPTGPYPYAGIPWFSTAFGRDGILTALQMLWLQPGLARGVLRFLAANQARDASAFRDASPGKILHETRKSEMAATGEVPFAKYYGGVDTTPLFVVLAGAYALRTGDSALIDELWPALDLAAQWIAGVCDASPLGLLAYQRGASSGLANQGWKDSEDSVFHADGRFPEGPIALVEVQGYACIAFETMADFAQRRGLSPEAARYRARAAALRERIESLFWMDEQQFYGIAVDGQGALCRVRASNAGHLLSFGLPPQARGEAVIARLSSSEFDNGWGVRTLASGQARFNPMSYHNGSVWPHDTALCAKGIARYGDKASAVRLLQTLHEAAVGFDMRLPELFCGFPRTRGEAPTAYPVACLPQAWATGAPFMLLEACLGISIDAARGEVRIDRPALPNGVDHLDINDLRVGTASISLTFTRTEGRIVPSSRSALSDDVRVITVL